MNLSISDIIAEVMPQAVNGVRVTGPVGVDGGLFVSRFSAFAPSTVLTLGGEAQPGKTVPVAGLQNIQCTIAPPSSARLQATEMKSAPAILSLQLGHVTLAGYFPQIPGADADWDATIVGPDGTTTMWDVVGAEADSQSQMTRVAVRIAVE